MDARTDGLRWLSWEVPDDAELSVRRVKQANPRISTEQLREQRQREVVQRAKPFRIRDTRVGFKGRSFRTPSTHRFIAPDQEFAEYACCSDVVAQSLTLSSKAGRALVIAVTHDDE